SPPRRGRLLDTAVVLCGALALPRADVSRRRGRLSVWSRAGSPLSQRRAAPDGDRLARGRATRERRFARSTFFDRLASLADADAVHDRPRAEDDRDATNLADCARRGAHTRKPFG